jgi:signal transduction histidine kinase
MAQLLQQGRTMKTAPERAITEEQRAERPERGFGWQDRGAGQVEYRRALEGELLDALAARRRAEAALIERERQVERLVGIERAARAEAERHVVRLREQIVQTLSREMRTPLAAILGWLRVVNEEPLDQASTRRALELIERNARVQMNLIEDLLTQAEATSIPPR